MTRPATPLLVHVEGNGWFALVTEPRDPDAHYGDLGRLSVYLWDPEGAPDAWSSGAWGSRAIGSVYPGPSWSAEARIPGTLRHGFLTGEEAVAYLVDCWATHEQSAAPFSDNEPRS